MQRRSVQAVQASLLKPSTPAIAARFSMRRSAVARFNATTASVVRISAAGYGSVLIAQSRHHNLKTGPLKVTETSLNCAERRQASHRLPMSAPLQRDAFACRRFETAQQRWLQQAQSAIRQSTRYRASCLHRASNASRSGSSRDAGGGTRSMPRCPHDKYLIIFTHAS
jgi:hypothetical protein